MWAAVGIRSRAAQPVHHGRCRGASQHAWTLGGQVLAPPAAHPCPRKLHHPGENCGCARRLDLRVPHGHSRAADKGSVPCARLQNLRWRLTRPGAQTPRARPGPGGLWGAPFRLPPSLRALAADHQGGCRVARPLSPERKLHSVMRASPCTASTREESPEARSSAPTGLQLIET